MSTSIAYCENTKHCTVLITQRIHNIQMHAHKYTHTNLRTKTTHTEAIHHTLPQRKDDELIPKLSTVDISDVIVKDVRSPDNVVPSVAAVTALLRRCLTAADGDAKWSSGGAVVIATSTPGVLVPFDSARSMSTEQKHEIDQIICVTEYSIKLKIFIQLIMPIDL